MSNQALTWAFDARVGNTHAKLVLIVIANRAGFYNECWPLIETIAYETELSRRTVFRALSYLTEKCFIIKSQRRSREGRQSSSMYICNMPECQSDTLEKSARVPNRTRQSASVGTHTDEPTLNPQGKNINKTLRGKKGKPRHGQKTKDGKRIWFDKGTADWQAYADDYTAKHQTAPPANWNGAGSWFNYFGE